MQRTLQKLTLPSLWFFNIILLSLGWILAAWAFPRLPEQMPVWLPFAGQDVMLARKSTFFFLYPAFQTLFFALFIGLGFFHIDKKKPSSQGQTDDTLLVRSKNLDREFVLLVLVFFNLIFIHIIRSLILLAHSIGEGVSPFYFYSLFGIILMLIPLFKLRQGMLHAEK